MSWLTDFFADRKVPNPDAGDNSQRVATTAWFKAEAASEAQAGTGKVATQVQTDAGTDDATFVTPKKLRWGFSALFASNGYIVFPTWLGGLILQWGNVANVPSASGTYVAFPLRFPTAVFNTSATIQNSGGTSLAMAAGTGLQTQLGMTVFNNGNALATAAMWWALGK